MRTGRGSGRGRAAAAVVLTLLFASAGSASPAGPTVFALDGETRLRRADDPSVWGRLLPAEGGEILLRAFPGETPALQIAILAGPQAISRATVELTPLSGRTAAVPVAIFREHYLTVSSRSHNDSHPLESLGWTAGARPRDGAMLGDVPDALVPISADAGRLGVGPDVPPGRTGTFWIDLPVPESTTPGDFVGTATVTVDGRSLATFRIVLEVAGPVLPRAGTSAFVFYEPERLGKRLGAANAAAAERQLWQLLHAHRLDAIAPLADAATAVRLRSAYDGTLFRPEAGYSGAGVGEPPAVVALGTYGTLGAPSPEAFERLDAVLAGLPLRALAATDLFVYAIDERCSSPRAGDWRRLLAARSAGGGTGGAMLHGARILVGQTCAEPPAQQDVDVALLPAAAFTRTTGEDARAGGRRAWIYNGSLPAAGTLLLDADPRGLTANGWIAAVMAIERWFYWESTFWDDDNRGGRGSIDPFATAESFHNDDGDSALGDGLLVYPGTQEGPFRSHSLGRAEVLPSFRLKALRRGLEDAGVIALAARERLDEAARLVAEAFPAALDEAPLDRPASWEVARRRFGDVRTALRGLVHRTDPMSSSAARAVFAELAVRRRRAIPTAERPHAGRSPWAAVAGLAVVVLAWGALVLRGRRRGRGSGGG